MENDSTNKTTSSEKDDFISIDSNMDNVKFHSLVVQGTEYQTLLTSKYINRKKWELPNEKCILSYIPGTIKEVYIKAGDKVEQDQPLLILEAMKMENTIFAPFTGNIKEVCIKEGDRIPKGVIMIEFE